MSSFLIIISVLLQLKILLYQRKQIPDQWDALVRQSTSTRGLSQLHENGAVNGENASRTGDMRDAMRHRRDMLRHKKLEERYLQVQISLNISLIWPSSHVFP